MHTCIENWVSKGVQVIWCTHARMNRLKVDSRVGLSSQRKLVSRKRKCRAGGRGIIIKVLLWIRYGYHTVTVTVTMINYDWLGPGTYHNS